MSPPPFLVTVLSVVTATSNPTVLARILILTVPKNLLKRWKKYVPGFSFKDDTLQYNVWVKSQEFGISIYVSLRAQFTIFGNFVVAKFSAAREGFKGGPILYLTSLCQHNYISQFNIKYHYFERLYLIKVWLWTITWTGMNKLSIYHSLKDLKVHHLSLVGLSLILCP